MRAPSRVLLTLIIVYCTVLFSGCKKSSGENKDPDPEPNNPEIPLEAAFEYNFVDEQFAPCKVSFGNQSKGADSYEWDFGDGTTATTVAPSTTYTQSKTFTIRLIAKKGSKSDTAFKVISVKPIKYSVRIILITPPDRAFNQRYYDALVMCADKIKQFYKEQMGGKTFVLNDPLIDTLTGQHEYDWYNRYNDTYSGTDPRFYGYYNTAYELQQVLGSDLDTEHQMNAVYVAAPGGGAGSTGLCALGDQDLDGLLGINPTDDRIDRWIGGSAHEWGHGFGLQHPSNMDPLALMWTGYATYPNCVLLEADKNLLSTLPYFK